MTLNNGASTNSTNYNPEDDAAEELVDFMGRISCYEATQSVAETLAGIVTYWTGVYDNASLMRRFERYWNTHCPEGYCLPSITKLSGDSKHE